MPQDHRILDSTDLLVDNPIPIYNNLVDSLPLSSSRPTLPSIPIPVVNVHDLHNSEPSRRPSKGLLGRIRAMSSDRYKPVLIQFDELDPSPLGVFGTAMGFLFSGLNSVSATEGPILLFPWLILLPGLLQLIAGWVDISRGNLFGALTFTGYGLFWFGFSSTLMIEVYADPEVQTSIPNQQLGVAFAGYALYTLGLMIIALPINVAFVILLLLIIAVCIMADCEVWIGISTIPGGVLSLIISLLSFYIYFSLIIRSLIGRDVLPLGPALFDVKTMKFRFVAFGRNIHDYSIGHLHHV